jgi:hypothetical protein
MTRISKKAERRNQSPRKHRHPSVKTGSLKDNLAKGYREHANAHEGSESELVFISKVR